MAAEADTYLVLPKRSSVQDTELCYAFLVKRWRLSVLANGSLLSRRGKAPNDPSKSLVDVVAAGHRNKHGLNVAKARGKRTWVPVREPVWLFSRYPCLVGKVATLKSVALRYIGMRGEVIWTASATVIIKPGAACGGWSVFRCEVTLEGADFAGVVAARKPVSDCRMSWPVPRDAVVIRNQSLLSSIQQNACTGCL